MMRKNALHDYVINGEEAITYLSSADEIESVLDLGACSLYVVRHQGKRRLLITSAGGEAASLPADFMNALA